MSMKIDFTDFDKRFKAVVEHAIPSEAAKGLFKAGNELLNDAITKRPMAPFDEGHLRASARTDQAKVERDKISVDCGFNIVYAARWHELTPTEDKRINWSLPGSGAKYLESKMTVYKDKYMSITAEYIKNSAK
jgi:hypothetical protein